MHIQHLTLQTADIAAQHHFFGDVLGLPIIAADTQAVTIRVGASWLTFEAGAMASHYHYAFDVPENQLQQARQWLAARTAILSDCTGKSDFYLADWKADSFYFRDGDGNVAEFIARHNLPTASTLPFDQHSILRLSEIGLATPHVLKTVTQLKSQTGLGIWRGAGSEQFTAMGNEYGLLIVVQEGRNWLPTNDTPAQPLPTQVRIAGIQSPVRMTNLPYSLLHADMLPDHIA